ncbi:uncharacterized protein LOC110427577 [Herrania umbratica]|uniref:Uncharacterized protein LOC110427577 n=1 Tax=Herrania umbratica TaxID=108875 RepID=A0A6J1BHP4_9ROSI|nr:uncharacterized protein LOC110427577 [Herrania umbratica]
MDGKRQIDQPKVTKRKKDHGLRKGKLDLKKEKEKVKFFAGLLAEVRAVQAELIEAIDSLHDPAESDLHLKCQQLRRVNTQGALLNTMMRNYIDRTLAVLLASEGKGN